MSAEVTVDSFEIREFLAKGGMGSVYRGRHRETGVPVAVKVISSETDTATVERFQEEVQAHAGLHHPGIVHLFEYGQVDERAEEASDGELTSGAPYVAMEYAEEGALRDRMPISSWQTLRPVLVQVLDALAHAHARGVIHRDLKPENLLVFEEPDDRALPFRLKLADFGIAHAYNFEALEGGDRFDSPVGTLPYMPPEQLRAEWRNHGPWTDLYALGCLAWELVCGRPPIEGPSQAAVAVRHATAPRPELEPQFAVPEDLEAWIHRAMAVDPEHRFPRAADALHWLPAGEERPGSEPPSGGAKIDRPGAASTLHSIPEVWTTTVADRETTDTGQTVTATADVSEPPTAGLAETERSERPPAPPPMPDSWRRESPGPMPSLLVGTGRGLFGLRETPFVDRDPERDRIWENLREVDETGQPRVVVVVGESGTGKSRLVEWTARRAHEVGAAEVMRAVHTEGGGGRFEGLGGMIQRLVRGHGLGRGEFYEHLLEHLPKFDEESVDREADARALTELVYPTDEDAESVDGPRYRFSSSSNKTGLVARTIRRYDEPRRPFVWLDDIQWGRLAGGLVEHLLETSFELPAALVAVTVRAEAVAASSELEERLAEWTSDEWCVRLDLEALASEDHRAFIDQMLPLEGDLAERLAARTEGNPLFATQVLRHLVEGDRLEVAPEGFSVPKGETLELPDDVHDIWMRRLERCIEDIGDGDPESVWRATERAAALGREVDGEEWRAVCQSLGVDAVGKLRSRLIERGLAERTDAGWAFAHGLLVDSLQKHAEKAGRWRAHHRKCAEMLEEVYPEHSKRTASRRAQHWIEAGELDEALGPLLEEVDRCYDTAEYTQAKRSLERRDELLDELGIPDDDPRSIDNDLRLAQVKQNLGVAPETVLGWVREARARTESDALLAKAWRVIAKCRRQMGDLQAATEAVERGVECARDSDSEFELIAVLNQAGWKQYWSGELDEAQRWCAEARDVARETGDPFGKIRSKEHLAWIALSRGDDERAEKIFEEVMEESREQGFPILEIQGVNGLAELARFRGATDEARSRYRRYGQLARELNVPEMMAYWYLNMGQVELMDGEFDAAERQLEKARRAFEEVSRGQEREHLLNIADMTHAAGTEQWSRFDELADEYTDGWPEEASAIKDHPWLLEMAGDYAAEAGEADRAENAWQLSRELWERLDDEESSERLGRKLADRSD